LAFGIFSEPFDKKISQVLKRQAPVNGDITGDSMKKLLSMGALFSLCLTASAAWTVGQTPSDFTLSDWDGGTWNLYEQRGKVVLLNFGATW
jgi:hypothetical protein